MDQPRPWPRGDNHQMHFSSFHSCVSYNENYPILTKRARTDVLVCSAASVHGSCVHEVRQVSLSLRSRRNCKQRSGVGKEETKKTGTRLLLIGKQALSKLVCCDPCLKKKQKKKKKSTTNQGGSLTSVGILIVLKASGNPRPKCWQELVPCEGS